MKQLIGTELKRFLRDWRRDNPVQRDVALVLQSVSYPANVGSLFRIADGAGITKMILTSATATPPQPTLEKVARGKHRTVEWTYVEQTEEALTALKTEGYTICAIEITDEAQPYLDVDYPPRVAFVLGNEDHGISKAVLAHCDFAVFVPMYGRGLSLNAHVSAAIVLYEAALQLPLE
jgi:tRNA (guanosine-2'-O-)-methyltransferase